MSDWFGWIILLLVVGLYLAYRKGRSIRLAEEAKSNSSGDDLSYSEIQFLVQSYGEVLSNPGPFIRPVSDLPASKEKIDRALLSAIRLTNDPVQRKHLCAAYICLSDFQEMTNSELSAQDFFNVSLSGDMDEPDEKFKERIKERISSMLDADDMFAPVREKVQVEAELRLKKLKSQNLT